MNSARLAEVLRRPPQGPCWRISVHRKACTGPSIAATMPQRDISSAGRDRRYPPVAPLRDSTPPLLQELACVWPCRLAPMREIPPAHSQVSLLGQAPRVGERSQALERAPAGGTRGEQTGLRPHPACRFHGPSRRHWPRQQLETSVRADLRQQGRSAGFTAPVASGAQGNSSRRPVGAFGRAYARQQDYAHLARVGRTPVAVVSCHGAVVRVHARAIADVRSQVLLSSLATYCLMRPGLQPLCTLSATGSTTAVAQPYCRRNVSKSVDVRRLGKVDIVYPANCRRNRWQTPLMVP